ncbi:hypothetical protein RCL1_005422 [Eukaryota sp. TZLM3-RCL]
MGSISIISIIWFISKTTIINLIPLWLFTLFLYVFPLVIGLFVRNLCLFRYGYFTQLIPISLNFSCSETKYSSFLWMKQSNLIDSSPKTVSLSDSEDEQLDSVLQGPGIDSLSPTIIVTKLFKNPYDVLTYTRVLINNANLKEKEITFLFNLISESLLIFPSCPLVFIYKSLIELFYSNDSLSAMSTCLSLTSLDIDLRLDSAFFGHYCRAQADNLRRTQSTGQNLDNNSYLLISRNLKSAIELHKDALDYLCAFWTVLAPRQQQTVDLSVLPNITNQVYSAKQKAENAFIKLASTCPGNKEVLTSYSQFASDVLLDEELAESLLLQCDLDSLERKTSDGASSRMTSSSHGKKQKRRKNVALLMSLGQSNETNQMTSSSSKLSKSINLSITLLLIICFASFFFISSGFTSIQNQYSFSFEIAHLGSSAMKVSSNLFYLTASTAHSINFGNQTVDDYRNGVIEQSFHGNFHLNRLLVGSQISPNPLNFSCFGFSYDPTVSLSSMSSYSFLTSPDLSRLDSSSSTPSTPSVRFVSLANLALDYFRRAIIYSKNESKLISAEIFAGSETDFVFTNRKVLGDASLRLLESTKIESLDEINLLILANSIVVVLIIVIIICMAFVLFSNTLSEISKRKNEIFSLFSFIPRKEIKSILSLPKFSQVSFNKRREVIEEIDCPFPHAYAQSTVDDYSSSDNEDNFVIEVDDSSKSDATSSLVSNGWKFPFVLIILISLSFLLLFSIFYSNNFKSNISFLINRNTEINSILANSFTLLEHGSLSSSVLLSFANSGDLKFYHQYLDLRYSTTRSTALSELRRSQISTENLEILSRNIYQQALIDYKDLIALKIVKFRFNISDYDMPEVAQFHYDVTTESEFRRETVDFSRETWYTDSITDSQLNSTELIELSRAVLSNRRHIFVEGDRLSSLFDFSEGVLHLFKSQFENTTQNVEFITLKLVILSSILLFVFVLIIGFIKKCLKPAVFDFKYHLLILFITILLFLISSVILATAQTNSFNNLTQNLDLSNQIEYLLTRVMESNVLLSLKAQLFVQNSDLIFNSDYENMLHYLDDLFDFLDDNHDSITNILGNSGSQLINNLIDLTEDWDFLAEIESIAMSLSAFSENIPESLFPLVSMTWNLTDQSNYFELLSTYSYTNWSNFYSNDVFDKSLPVDQISDLSRFILSSDLYKNLVTDSSHRLVSIFSSFRQSSLDSFDNIFTRVSVLSSLFSVVSIATLGLILISCYFIYIK